MDLCPGCGGRNEPNERACAWCGRPFVVEHREISAAWAVPVAISGIAVLLVAVVMVALIGARASSSRATDTLPPMGTAAPDGETVQEREFTPFLETEPGSGPVEFVRITNTGGVGAYLRLEPRFSAPRIVAYRDGTVLRVTGPDATTDGTIWRQVEDQRGNRGWTPLEYLVPSDVAF